MKFFTLSCHSAAQSDCGWTLPSLRGDKGTVMDNWHYKVVNCLGKLYLKCLPFQLVLLVFSFSIGRITLSWEEDIKYTHQQFSWQPMVCGFVVRSECISEELVWMMPEFIFLLNFILYFITWQKSTNLKAKTGLIIGWSPVGKSVPIQPGSSDSSQMCRVISWKLCVELLWKRILHCIQKPGHSSTSQLPKSYLNRIKELKPNNLMTHLTRSCLPKVIGDE